MAHKLIWSSAACDDLHDITLFIARDNRDRAMSFGYELISLTDRLQEFPDLGRVVPEYANENIREIIFPPYRIVYRINHDGNLCEIARVLAFGARNPAAVTRMTQFLMIYNRTRVLA